MTMYDVLLHYVKEDDIQSVDMECTRLSLSVVYKGSEIGYYNLILKTVATLYYVLQTL